MTKEILCPVCHQSDQVDKVSTIYMTGLARRKLSGTAESGELQTKFSSFPGLVPLSRKLAPPSSGTQVPTRPIHPDMVVVAFSLITPIFLYGIFNSQRVLLLPAVGVLLVFYGLYFWQRKKLIDRFEKEQAARQAAAGRIQRGIERWMRLYYCAREDGVFEPGSRQLTPVDQMMGYLFHE